MFSQVAMRSTRMLVSGIFKPLRTFVDLPDVSDPSWKIGNDFFLTYGV